MVRNSKDGLEGTDELFSKIQTTYENTVATIKKMD